MQQGHAFEHRLESEVFYCSRPGAILAPVWSACAGRTGNNHIAQWTERVMPVK
jgi:hypothetical protein